jgi:predicted esterase YcpF (UPF0227 family)
MNNILYLHGFASSSDSTKAKVFKKFIKEHNDFRVITPDLPNNLVGWSELIKKLIKEHKPIAFMGSSLGGFYSTYFARKLEVIDILLNPAVLPAKGMKTYLGKNNNYSTGEEFLLTDRDIEHLFSMQKTISNKNTTINSSLVILETGDEILDYKQALKFYAGSQIKVIHGGSHSLDSFEQWLDQILLFLKNALK